MDKKIKEIFSECGLGWRMVGTGGAEEQITHFIRAQGIRAEKEAGTRMLLAMMLLTYSSELWIEDHDKFINHFEIKGKSVFIISHLKTDLRVWVPTEENKESRMLFEIEEYDRINRGMIDEMKKKEEKFGEYFREFKLVEMFNKQEAVPLVLKEIVEHLNNTLEHINNHSKTKEIEVKLKKVVSEEVRVV